MSNKTKPVANPIVDIIAREFSDALSDETKMGLYNDLKAKHSDQARDIMEQSTIERALDEFAFTIAWRLQHQLLNSIMNDKEIEQRIYLED